MNINRIIPVVVLGMALTACATTSDPDFAGTTAHEQDRMIAQAEQERVERQFAAAERIQREKTLERQSEIRQAQNRTPPQ